MAEPRVLLFDIETTHSIVAKFGLRDEYVPHGNVLQEAYIVCAAWQWLGERAIQAVSVLDDPQRYKKTPHDDRHVVTTLHRVLSEADVVIAHNGDRFDLRWVNGRILFHRMAPLPPLATIDTLKVSRRVFMLNSNRLDFLGKHLGFGGKINTPPGLWIDVLRGGEQAVKAINTMVRYNKGDVKLLRQVYERLLPFIPDHFNRGLVADGDGCPRCGSDKVQRRGVHKAMTRTYQRYQCSACAGWFRSLKADSKRVPRRAL